MLGLYQVFLPTSVPFEGISVSGFISAPSKAFTVQITTGGGAVVGISDIFNFMRHKVLFSSRFTIRCKSDVL